MAALRVGIRSYSNLLTSKYYFRVYDNVFTKGGSSKTLLSLHLISSRNSSYRSSPIEGPQELYTGFEICKSPEEWKWVERILRPKVAPEPKPKSEYPSGWRPPSEAALSLPYFVKRNKNHMLPVYMLIELQQRSHRTVIRNIQGDIWLMESELRKHLESVIQKPVIIMVHEVCCFIKIKGDVFLPVEQWLYGKGF